MGGSGSEELKKFPPFPVELCDSWMFGKEKPRNIKRIGNIIPEAHIHWNPSGSSCKLVFISKLKWVCSSSFSWKWLSALGESSIFYLNFVDIKYCKNFCTVVWWLTFHIIFLKCTFDSNTATYWIWDGKNFHRWFQLEKNC